MLAMTAIVISGQTIIKMPKIMMASDSMTADHADFLRSQPIFSIGRLMTSVFGIFFSLVIIIIAQMCYNK